MHLNYLSSLLLSCSFPLYTHSLFHFLSSLPPPQHCVCHMLFLLVVLMVNYQDSVQETQGRLLHSAVKHSLTTNLNTITG